MDLQLTRRGDYALRAALCLARSFPGGSYRKLREIAAETEIPERYTHEIVSLLVRAGLVEAMSGKMGGYRLAKQPAAISLLDVIEAGEGSLRQDRCALTGGPCHQQTVCAVHSMLEGAARALTASLSHHSLQALVVGSVGANRAELAQELPAVDPA